MTINILEQIKGALPWGEATLLGSRYAGATCAGCRAIIPRGDTIAYYPEAPRGARVWHPACVVASPEALAASRAISKAAKSDGKGNEKARVEAETEAVQAVLAWLGTPDRRRLLAFVANQLVQVYKNPPAQAQAPAVPKLRIVTA